MDEREQIPEPQSPTQGKIPLSSRGEPKGPPDACLFVASLGSDSDEEKLKEYFSKYGEVLKVKLLKDKKTNRPYAFVQFLTLEDADEAVSDPQNHILDGRHLRVEKAKVNRTLFLAKLSRSMVNQELREVAEEFGPVENVTIIKNHQTNKSKGCGFVKFVYREDAMDGLVGMKQKYKKWVIEGATSANDPDVLGIDKQNVFVGGLSPKVTKELLQERFSQYGELDSITLINPNQSGIPTPSPELEDKIDSVTGERSAFAFLRYTDWQASASAIETENGADWFDKRIRVQYCETPEMKYKKRFNKYLTYINQFNQPYFYSQVPNPVYMVPMYYNNGGVASNGFNNKYNPYQRKDNVPYSGWGNSYPMWNYNQGWPIPQPGNQVPGGGRQESQVASNSNQERADSHPSNKQQAEKALTTEQKDEALSESMGAINLNSSPQTNVNSHWR